MPPNQTHMVSEDHYSTCCVLCYRQVVNIHTLNSNDSCTRWIYQYVLTSCYWFENIIIKTNQCVSLAISMPKQSKRITKKCCIVRLIVTILSKYVIIWTFQTMLITIFISNDSNEKLTMSVTRDITMIF